MNARFWLSLLVASFCALYTHIGRTDDTTLPSSIGWDAPPECSEAAFRQRMREANPAILVRVRIENVGSTRAPNYRGTLELDTVKRSVESPRCDEVVRALALAGNMLLDREPEPPKPIAIPPSPDTAPEREPERARVPEARSSLPGSAIFFAGAGAAFDGSRAVPVFTAGAMSTIGKKVAIGLGGEFTGRFTRAEVAPYTASLFWLTVRYQVCALFLGNTPFRVGPCVTTDLGLVHGEVSGALDAAAQTRFWSTLGPSLRAFWIPENKRSFVLGLHVSSLFPLTRTSFSVDQGPTLYASPTVQPEITLSAGYTFQ